MNIINIAFAQTTGATGINNLITRVQDTLNAVVGLLFALALVFFIWGVVQYISSGGDEEKLKSGKRHMIWGIIGLAVMAGVWVLVNLLLNYLGGSNAAPPIPQV